MKLDRQPTSSEKTSRRFHCRFTSNFELKYIPVVSYMQRDDIIQMIVYNVITTRLLIMLCT